GGAGLQFTEQPRILHRDHRLRREVLQQCDLLVGERPHLLPEGCNSTEQFVVFAQRYDDYRAGTTKSDKGLGKLAMGEAMCRRIDDMDEILTSRNAGEA